MTDLKIDSVMKLTYSVKKVANNTNTKITKTKAILKKTIAS